MSTIITHRSGKVRQRKTDALTNEPRHGYELDTARLDTTQPGESCRVTSGKIFALGGTGIRGLGGAIVVVRRALCGRLRQVITVINKTLERTP